MLTRVQSLRPVHWVSFLARVHQVRPFATTQLPPSWTVPAKGNIRITNDNTLPSQTHCVESLSLDVFDFANFLRK